MVQLQQLACYDADDPGVAVMTYRSLPVTVPVETLGTVVHSLLTGYPVFYLAYHRQYAGVLSLERIAQMRQELRPTQPGGRLKPRL
jgi:hypothetical protein